MAVGTEPPASELPIVTGAESAKASTSAMANKMPASFTQRLQTELQPAFKKAFGRDTDGQFVSAAPGRVEILGNHTDYNEGFVLSAAIDLSCHCLGGFSSGENAAGKSGAISLSIKSASFPDDAAVVIADILDVDGAGNPVAKDEHPKWTAYVKGVVVEFFGKYCGAARLGEQAVNRNIDLFVQSDVPLGAAVSSSAALEMAVCKFLAAVFPPASGADEELDHILLCKKAENDYVGMGCGILDQFSSNQGEAGQLLCLDCRYPIEKLRKVVLPPVPASGDTPAGRLVFVLSNTHKTHALVDGQYAELKRCCFESCDVLKETLKGQNEGITHLRDVPVSDFNAVLSEEKFADAKAKLEANDAELLRRARHIVTEDDRVEEGMRILAGVQGATDGDGAAIMQAARQFGTLMTASHASSRDDFRNSCLELDQMVAEAVKVENCLGARLMGGGFGGCAICLVFVEEGKVAEGVAKFSDALKSGYKTGCESWNADSANAEKVEWKAPTILSVEPGNGAWGSSI